MKIKKNIKNIFDSFSVDVLTKNEKCCIFNFFFMDNDKFYVCILLNFTNYV